MKRILIDFDSHTKRILDVTQKKYPFLKTRAATIRYIFCEFADAVLRDEMK